MVFLLFDGFLPVTGECLFCNVIMTVIEYIEFDEELPTPLSVVEFLNRTGHPLVDVQGNSLIYTPWGSTPTDQVYYVAKISVSFYKNHFFNLG